MSDPVIFDFANCFRGAVGGRGLDAAWLDEIKPALIEAIRKCQAQRGQGMTGWFELPYEREQVGKILASAREKEGKFEDIVVLGIGGSALGTIALRNALLHPFHNFLPRKERGGLPRLHVLDNIDPELLAAFFEDVVDLRKALFIVISKSGATAETMAQFLTAYDLLDRRLGTKAVAKQMIAVTDRSRGILRPLADKLGLESYVIADGVGGRFSALSPVSLLPAALAGIDITDLLAGAADMDARCRREDPLRNPAAMFAAVHFLAERRRHANISVMMPYASGLKEVADWYCQLWAESLGKARDRQGRQVFVGQTPVKALGVTDQHSQVQLYTEGPFDKIITIIQVQKFGKRLTIPARFAEVDELAYLGDKDFTALLEAERRGTEMALTQAGRMNLTISLPRISAHSLGQLFFCLEVATALAGELYDIDAFNQPGVEAGKIATYALMGRKGYDDKAREIARQPSPDRRFRIEE